MDELRDYLHMIVDDLDIQIIAAKSRNDFDDVIYLQGKRQGVAIALERLAQLEGKE